VDRVKTHETISKIIGNKRPTFRQLIIRNYEPPKTPLYTRAAGEPSFMDLFSLEGKGTPFFSLRLPKAIRVRLESEARGLGVAASTYVRAILVAHFTFQRRENEGVTHTVTHPVSTTL